jgi:hypothetical protein
MPASRAHRRGARRRTPSRAEHFVKAGVAALSLALLTAFALIYFNPGSTADAIGPPKLVGTPRAASQSPEPTELAHGQVDAAGRAPLTGVPVDGSLDHAAVTVKVSNTPDAHPHRGLGDADIVFVEPITGATTRLAAIFHSNLTAEVGPVRSLRPMDASIVGPTGGVLANTMAQQWVLDYIDAEADVANLGTMRVPRGTYRIDGSRVAPNHVFAQPAVLLDIADRTMAPEPYFQYAADVARSTAQQEGNPAAAVTIGYGGSSTATWRYDTDAGRWRRSEDWSDHILENGEQVAANNVMVLRAARDYGFPQAGADMTVLDLVNTSGTLQLFTGDAVVDGLWSKAGVNEPFQFLTQDGEPLLLAPGATWVELPVDTMAVTIEAGGEATGEAIGEATGEAITP